MFEWIPVGKRLPEVDPEGYETVPVLIARSNTPKIVGAFAAGTYRGTVAFITDEGLQYKNVTHWAEMPRHPNAEVPC